MSRRRPTLPPFAVALAVSEAQRYRPTSIRWRAVQESAPAVVEADAEPGEDADHNQLKNYWLYGKGLAKWAASPHPWRALYRHLKKHMPDEMAKRVTSQWYFEHFGHWPGQKKGNHAVDGEQVPTGQVAICETPVVLKAEGSRPGRHLVQLVKAGWSLNGNYYPASVLERDGPRAWPAGTKNYVDHDTDAEEEARPSGSLMRLASYQTSDARWDRDRQALVAEVRTFAAWRDTVADWAESGVIGMSIRAWVTGDHGEAEGRQGFIVSSIAEGRSCDYVTVPAAGGAILAVLESVQHRTTEAANIGAWLESRLHLSLTQLGDDMYGDGRLTRDERIVLSAAIGDGLQAWTARVEQDAPQLFERGLWSYPEPATTGAEEARRAAEATAEETRTALGRAVTKAYGGDQDTYAWVRDFDPDRALVWFDVSTKGEQSTWQQGYATSDSDADLVGSRLAVTVRTVYDPVAATESADPTPPPGNGQRLNPAGVSAIPTVTSSTPPPPPPPPSGGRHTQVTAEAADTTTTDGTPPTGNTQLPEEEPAMTGPQTGSPPVQAGTATVPDGGQPPTPTNPNDPAPAPTSPPPPAPDVPAQESATAKALEAVTAQLAAMQQQLAAVTARAEARDAETRRLRNDATARQAVTAAVESATVPAAWRTQIAPRVTAAVLAHVPTAESGDVDTAALDTAIKAAVETELGYVRGIQAQALEEAGLGLPAGLGATRETPTDDGLDTELKALFEGSLGLPSKAADIAVKGRG